MATAANISSAGGTSSRDEAINSVVGVGVTDGTGVFVAVSVGPIGKTICAGKTEFVGDEVTVGVADGMASWCEEAVDMTDKVVDITAVAVPLSCKLTPKPDRLQPISEHPIRSRQIEFKNTYLYLDRVIAIISTFQRITIVTGTTDEHIMPSVVTKPRVLNIR